MKKTWTLRRQLNILLALIVIFQSIALIFALWFSQVYFMLDAEAVRLLSNTTETRAQTFDSSVGAMIGNMANETENLNSELVQLAQQNQKSPEDLYLDDDSYNQAALVASATLVSILKQNHVTGAYFILNGSNANKADTAAHSAVYIRNSTPDVSASTNYSLEIGPTAVSKEYHMPTSIRWNLDMRSDKEENYFDFYEKPIWASTQFKGSEMERFGYWSTPKDILNDNQQVVCYTMPVLDENGNGYGVIGIEIAMPYFSQHYLPDSDLLYHNSFYVISEMHDNALDLGWFIPSGVLAKTYLKSGEPLQLKAVKEGGIFETTLDELGTMYSSVQKLKVYSENSPFVDQNWTLSCFVPSDVLTENSVSVREKVFYSIALTTVLAFTAVFVLVYFFTRKISRLSKYVRNLSPYDEIHFLPTGMREIDDLTSAVQLLNQSLMNVSKTTSKILELSLLPIGGYEVLDNNKHVILTDFLYKLLHIDQGSLISKDDWVLFYNKLTQYPIDDHDDIYEYYDEYAGKQLWLRILEARQPTGSVGVILDVTADIEENRRLANELDYDSLTHLFSNTALKREANRKIKEKPDKIGAMIFIDLDNLKYINDNFGHDMGDRLIIRASEIFRYFEQFKGIVSRISGDEFAVYLHGYEDQDELRKIIGNLYSYSKSFSFIRPNGTSNRIRFSSGVAWYPEDADNVIDLLKLSDFAMYEAKNKEKGRLFEFNRDYYQQMSYLLENREVINRLLDEQLIHFAFQPIVDLKTGEIIAYEALMRSLLNDFKNPMEILTVAAAQSKSAQLERMIILMAYKTVEENSQEIGERRIFINSIPSQRLSEEDHLMLERHYRHIFKNIVIEVTEEENNNSNNMNEKIKFIRKSGIQIAVDDFGSGYSNELRILSLLPDIIKIDMKLIQGIHSNSDKQNIVANLVEFCHNKGIKVVAEGIEESMDLVKIIEMDIDYAQGYYLGRPTFSFAKEDERLKKEILDLHKK
ncbi:bifunctional diguanylate cyclase/phosphodiesterase [Acetobacterium tundrae]|uniref:EAL domain-containing protein n=1 Tax=Acetobacterium tundrae TaxID=132932 RepID=A0ABR6WIA2_9FIRM|nr:bifunctional diguanylate cyclase/phosphodiesterase [Acetobacterium tundrae]MBC3796084.1 EAL domain-containing protein [Acetobacterium tundrae]